MREVPTSATVNGSSPTYTWSAALTKLKRGTHTLKAALYLGGVEKASDSVTVTAR